MGRVGVSSTIARAGALSTNAIVTVATTATEREKRTSATALPPGVGTTATVIQITTLASPEKSRARSLRSPSGRPPSR